MRRMPAALAVGVWVLASTAGTDEIGDLVNALKPSSLDDAVWSGNLLKAAVGRAKLARANSWRPPLPAELKHGLILHYDFDRDEPNGRVTDTSGRRNHGERNAARWTEHGQKGGGCQVDGTGYVTVPSTKKMHLAGDLTISAWVNVREFKGGPSGRSEFMGSRLDGIEGRGEFVWPFRDGRMYYAYWSGDGDREATEWVPGPSSGRWYHVAVVVSSSGDFVALYLDGYLSGRDDRFAKDFTASNSEIRIGKVWFGAPAGTFDEVMIHDRVLSAYEINLIYILQGGRAERPGARAGLAPVVEGLDIARALPSARRRLASSLAASCSAAPLPR